VRQAPEGWVAKLVNRHSLELRPAYPDLSGVSYAQVVTPSLVRCVRSEVRQATLTGSR